MEITDGFALAEATGLIERRVPGNLREGSQRNAVVSAVFRLDNRSLDERPAVALTPVPGRDRQLLQVRIAIRLENMREPDRNPARTRRRNQDETGRRRPLPARRSRMPLPRPQKFDQQGVSLVFYRRDPFKIIRRRSSDARGQGSDYQGRGPLRSEKVPVGPSGPSRASFTIASVPSATVWVPRLPFRSVEVNPGSATLTRIPGNAFAY